MNGQFLTDYHKTLCKLHNNCLSLLLCLVFEELAYRLYNLLNISLRLVVVATSEPVPGHIDYCIILL